MTFLIYILIGIVYSIYDVYMAEKTNELGYRDHSIALKSFVFIITTLIWPFAILMFVIRAITKLARKN
jgi:hypothetical protein